MNPFADLIPSSLASAVAVKDGTPWEEDLALGEKKPDPEPPAFSEWAVEVVTIRGLTPIDGADFTEIARFSQDLGDEQLWDYPVVVRKGSYKPGDLAVYVPVDSVLPDEPELSFLGKDIRRLKAKKIRGVYSEGLLLPWSDVAAMVARKVPPGVLPGDDAKEGAEAVSEALREVLRPGMDVAEVLGISRWLPPTRSRMAGTIRQGSRKEPDESIMPVYRVSNAKKGEGINALAPDTRVIVTEKLHGANIRFMLERHAGEGDEGAFTFHLGSHNTMRDSDNCGGPGPGQDWFQRAAGCHGLQDALLEADCCNIALYGEVLGVQDLTYGASAELPQIRIFDAYAISAERWLAWGDIVEICRAVGLDHVPVIYDGPLNECKYRELAEGETCVGNVPHVREGVVIRTFAGAARSQGPLRKWKYVGQGYRTRKGNQTDEQE